MIGNWKRGALVGVASAGILTLGGGAAMAAGSHGASPAAVKATALAKSCGVTWVSPAKPGIPTVTIWRLPSAGSAPMVWTSVTPLKALPKAGLTHVLTCVVPPKGAKCVVALRAEAPGTPQVKALRALPALPGQKAVNAPSMRALPIPGCATLRIADCKSTAGKAMLNATSAAPGRQVTVRCGVAKATSAPAKP